MLYQLSYFRKNRPYQSYPFPHTVSRRRRACNSNRHSFLWEVMDSNHRRHSQQLYSLPHLATLVTSLVLLLSREEFASLVFPEGIGSFVGLFPFFLPRIDFAPLHLRFTPLVFPFQGRLSFYRRPVAASVTKVSSKPHI